MPRRHLQRDRVGEGPQRLREICAGHIQWHGCRTGCQHQVPVREADTAGRDHFLGVDVDAIDGHTADEVDVIAHEPGGAVEIDVGLTPAQILLAQGRLGVGQRRVGRQYTDGNMAMSAAERLSRAEARGTTADGEKARCHHAS